MGESFTATCLTLSPNDILAQSADATETETSGVKLTTIGRSSCILSRLSLSCSSGSFPPLAPANESSMPSIEASCSTSRVPPGCGQHRVTLPSEGVDDRAEEEHLLRGEEVEPVLHEIRTPGMS